MNRSIKRLTEALDAMAKGKLAWAPYGSYEDADLMIIELPMSMTEIGDDEDYSIVKSWPLQYSEDPAPVREQMIGIMETYPSILNYIEPEGRVYTADTIQQIAENFIDQLFQPWDHMPLSSNYSDYGDDES